MVESPKRVRFEELKFVLNKNSVAYEAVMLKRRVRKRNRLCICRDSIVLELG